jgi:hypothetical protein
VTSNCEPWHKDPARSIDEAAPSLTDVAEVAALLAARRLLMRRL